MVLHIVLFRPKPGLTAPEQAALERSLARACQEIPSVRRFRIGRRLLHGRGYERAMTEDLPHAAVIEFDDLEGLRTYLEHPAHDELAARFTAALDVGLIYDFEMREGEARAALTR